MKILKKEALVAFETEFTKLEKLILPKTPSRIKKNVAEKLVESTKRRLLELNNEIGTEKSLGDDQIARATKKINKIINAVSDFLLETDKVNKDAKAAWKITLKNFGETALVVVAPKNNVLMSTPSIPLNTGLPPSVSVALATPPPTKETKSDDTVVTSSLPVLPIINPLTQTVSPSGTGPSAGDSKNVHEEKSRNKSKGTVSGGSQRARDKASIEVSDEEDEVSVPSFHRIPTAKGIREGLHHREEEDGLNRASHDEESDHDGEYKGPSTQPSPRHRTESVYVAGDSSESLANLRSTVETMSAEMDALKHDHAANETLKNAFELLIQVVDAIKYNTQKLMEHALNEKMRIQRAIRSNRKKKGKKDSNGASSGSSVSSPSVSSSQAPPPPVSPSSRSSSPPPPPPVELGSQTTAVSLPRRMWRGFVKMCVVVTVVAGVSGSGFFGTTLLLVGVGAGGSAKATLLLTGLGIGAFIPGVQIAVGAVLLAALLAATIALCVYAYKKHKQPTVSLSNSPSAPGVTDSLVENVDPALGATNTNAQVHQLITTQTPPTVSISQLDPEQQNLTGDVDDINSVKSPEEEKSHGAAESTQVKPLDSDDEDLSISEISKSSVTEPTHFATLDDDAIKPKQNQNAISSFLSRFGMNKKPETNIPPPPLPDRGMPKGKESAANDAHDDANNEISRLSEHRQSGSSLG